jgi:hypothetical protein
MMLIEEFRNDLKENFNCKVKLIEAAGTSDKEELFDFIWDSFVPEVSESLEDGDEYPIGYYDDLCVALRETAIYNHLKYLGI